MMRLVLVLVVIGAFVVVVYRAPVAPSEVGKVMVVSDTTR